LSGQSFSVASNCAHYQRSQWKPRTVCRSGCKGTSGQVSRPARRMRDFRQMKRKLTIGYFVLAITGHVSVADVVDQCNRNLAQPEVRVRACTEIITNPSFGPDEKARAYALRGNAHTDAGAIRSALRDFDMNLDDNGPAK
jgi:hypothetical protein